MVGITQNNSGDNTKQANGGDNTKQANALFSLWSIEKMK